MASRLGPSVTHVVKNQAVLFRGCAFRGDNALRDAVAAFAPAKVAAASQARLERYGAWAGSQAVSDLARLANTHGPQLRQFDRNGNRVDVAEYDASYHEIYRYATEAGVPSLAWRGEDPCGGGSMVVRSALSVLHYEAEQGTGCPLTMTFAAVPALRHSAEAFSQHCAKAIAPAYDPRDVPMQEKNGIVLGMSMTEKTGGSDVRSNTTTATPVVATPGAAPAPGSAFYLRGHKWFTSAPNCDAFLTLAYVPSPNGSQPPALSCFVVPRWLPDGSRNTGFRVMRLKEKLGDRSNASSEVEYDNAIGHLLGPVGRGVNTILEMVVHTRLDCASGSAGLMRLAVRAATHHAAQRRAFGALLTRQPAMMAVLAELAVESEAAVATSILMARCFDECSGGGGGDEAAAAQAFRRLAVAVAKFFLCKRAPAVVNEALECVGGNGYAEEWEFPRWFRQSPLNAIWEGSGNVIALDILRTCAKEPLALASFLQRVGSTAHAHPALARHWRGLRAALAAAAGPAAAASAAALDPLHARFLAEGLAVALQGHALALVAAAAAAGGGGGGERSRDVLELWCRRYMPAEGVAAPAVFFGSLPPPAAAGGETLALVQRIVDQEVATIAAAAAFA